MRAIFFVITALIFAAPSIAADYSEKPALTKGTKSYQSRVVPSEEAKIQSIEPAAGADVSDESPLQQNVAVDVTPEDQPVSKPMKLHGKK